MIPTPGLEAAFWALVDKNGPVSPHSPDGEPCWEWTGGRYGKDDEGQYYGEFSFEGDQESAHRVSWGLTHGWQFTPGWTVHHECHFKMCVRPSHLLEVSWSDNLQHRVRANRNSRLGVRGVSLQPNGRYRGIVTVNYRQKSKSGFPTIEAALAWCAETRAAMRSGTI